MTKSQTDADCNKEEAFVQLADEPKFGSGPGFGEALASAQAWAQKYSRAEDIPDSEIPSSYDLRNISGFDFTGHVRDQQGCASCYAFSFL